jgi:hypothetical protein
MVGHILLEERIPASSSSSSSSSEEEEEEEEKDAMAFLFTVHMEYTCAHGVYLGTSFFFVYSTILHETTCSFSIR